MSLASRVGAGFLLLVTLMAALGWHQLALIYGLHAESRSLAELSFRAATSSLEIRESLARLRDFGSKFLVLRDGAYATELERVRAATGSEIERLAEFASTEAERRENARLRELWEGYASLAAERERQVLASPGADEEAIGAELGAELDALGAQLERVTRTAQAATAGRVQASAERVERARRLAWAATAVALGLAALVSLGVVGALMRPLWRLTHGTRELARGRFGHRVTPTGSSELRSLAEDFNRMAEQLSELDRLKKDFLAGVSHDLKAPLASMQETTRLLLEGLPGETNERQRRLLELNLQCGNRLTRMIEDLLSLARLEAGTVSYEMAPQDLAALVRSARAELESLAAEKDLRWRQELPEERVPVTADAGALAKVLTNLLSNAIKFTPPGGEIGLAMRELSTASAAMPPAAGARLAAGERAVLVEVSDTGPGVPDAHKAKIFERFYRLEPSGAQGTGLGLAIARELAAAHGGELWVEDRPGGGSVFRLLLWAPAGEVEEPSRAPARRARPAAAAALGVFCLVALAGCRAATPPPVAQPSPLELADALYERGELAEAAAAYERCLAAPEAEPGTDRALFRLALLHALADSPLRDPSRARELFGEVIERFPQSPYRDAAEHVLRLESEVSRLRREAGELRRQLEELKRIDLGG